MCLFRAPSHSTSLFPTFSRFRVIFFLFICLFGIVTLFFMTPMVLAQELDLSALSESNITEDVSNDNNSDTTEVEKVNPNTATGSILPSKQSSLLTLVRASGWIGALLLLASMIALALAIKLCLVLRRSKFIPTDLLNTVTSKIASGEYREALGIAETSNSPLGFVCVAGLKEIDRGWNAISKSLEDAMFSLSAKLCRKTEPLSIIGNIAPMLGLLGTVMGMVQTFGELAVSDGSGRNLANGIYFALVTTVAGLIVAIPVLIAHAILNARVASLLEETASVIDKAFTPLKRLKSTVSGTSFPYTSGQTIGSTSPSPLKKSPATHNNGLREVTQTSSASQTSRSRESTKEENANCPTTRPSLSLKARRKDEE